MADVFDYPGRGRPKKDSTMDSLSLRVPDELVGKIDSYTTKLQEEAFTLVVVSILVEGSSTTYGLEQKE